MSPLWHKADNRRVYYLSAFGGTADNDGGRILGTGQMGKVMAANLLKAGHRVRAWDKSSKPLHAIVAAN